MPLEPIQPTDALRRATPTIDIVIPVYNEAATLANNVATLRAWLDVNLPYRWRIVIADNASIAATLAIARALAVDDRVRVLHLDHKGRGRALKAAWLASDADIVAYMDVDLSTNLASLPPLLEPLVAGESDIAIGSRLRRGAVVTRQWKREALSRGYNLLIRTLFRPGFSDAQCGFKALTREAAQALLPAVENDEWFFDTELLLLAVACGVRIREIPVEWIEDLDSRVDIPKTIREDLHGLWRMRFGRRPRSDAPPAPPRRIGHSDIGRSAARADDVVSAEEAGQVRPTTRRRRLRRDACPTSDGRSRARGGGSRAARGRWSRRRSEGRTRVARDRQGAKEKAVQMSVDRPDQRPERRVHAGRG